METRLHDEALSEGQLKQWVADSYFANPFTRFLHRITHHRLIVPAMRLSGRTLARLPLPVVPGPRMETVPVRIADWPDSLTGLRIGLLADFHVDPYTGWSRIRQAVDAVMCYRPDLILLAGDYASESAEYFVRGAGALRRLQAPLGVYAVLGNHDYMADARIIAATLADVGVRLLRNEWVTCAPRGTSGFVLVGLDDSLAGRLDCTVFRQLPEGLPRIVLVHEPDVADELPPGIALQMSGHSHGGQIRIGNWIPYLPPGGRTYISGLCRTSSGHLVYVSRGVGYVHFPLRINSPAEVSILTMGRA